MGVTHCLTIAVRGSKSDIKDLHKRLVAFKNEGKVTMDYRTRALVRMLDDLYDYNFIDVELKPPTMVEFGLCWEKRFPLGKIIGQLQSAYDEAEVFFYFTSDNCPYPIVYAPDEDVFEFDEPIFCFDEDFDAEEDEIPGMSMMSGWRM